MLEMLHRITTRGYLNKREVEAVPLILRAIEKELEVENSELTHLAQIAYEVYAEHQNWKNYQGNPIPPWDQVRDDIKGAWVSAIRAVLDLAK